jgi:hypothetical protein
MISSDIIAFYFLGRIRQMIIMEQLRMLDPQCNNMLARTYICIKHVGPHVPGIYIFLQANNVGKRLPTCWHLYTMYMYTPPSTCCNSANSCACRRSMCTSTTSIKVPPQLMQNIQSSSLVATGHTKRATSHLLILIYSNSGPFQNQRG